MLPKATGREALVEKRIARRCSACVCVRVCMCVCVCFSNVQAAREVARVCMSVCVCSGGLYGLLS